MPSTPSADEAAGGEVVESRAIVPTGAVSWAEIGDAGKSAWLGHRPRNPSEVAAILPRFELGGLNTTVHASRENGRLLEVGCGPGTRSIAMAQAGWEVTAVDPDEEALRVFAARLERDPEAAAVADRLTIRKCFVEDLEPGEPFDAVFAFDFVGNYPGPGDAFSPSATCRRLKSLATHCRSGGLVIMDWLNPFVFWPTVRMTQPTVPVTVDGEAAVIQVKYEPPTFLADPPLVDVVGRYCITYADGSHYEHVVHQSLFWFAPEMILEMAAAAGLELADGAFGVDESAWRVTFRRSAASL